MTLKNLAQQRQPYPLNNLRDYYLSLFCPMSAIWRFLVQLGGIGKGGVGIFSGGFE